MTLPTTTAAECIQSVYDILTEMILLSISANLSCTEY